jgi:uncharacterized membrane protein
VSIIRSVLLTLSVSALFGIVLMFFGISFVATFIIATITQFIIFFILGSIIEFLNEIKMKEINAMRLAELSKQLVEVECPCYKKHRDTVPVVVNGDNNYKCTECNKLNKVIVVAETAHTTEIAQTNAEN